MPAVWYEGGRVVFVGRNDIVGFLAGERSSFEALETSKSSGGHKEVKTARLKGKVRGKGKNRS
jgi:hypothetical protein